MKNHADLRIFTGTANRPLALEVCRYLGVTLGAANVRPFKDNEPYARLEDNVRGRDVVLIQPTNATPKSSWDNAGELFMLARAARDASASSVIAVIPYLLGTRMDRKDTSRVAVTSKLMIDLAATAGVDRLVFLDLHAAQEQSFPGPGVRCDHLYVRPVFLGEIRNRGLPMLSVASADIGGGKIINSYSKRLDAPLIIVHKAREGDTLTSSGVLGDPKGRHCFIVEDESATGSSLIKAAEALIERGALSVRVVVTHAKLIGDAVKRLDECAALTEILVTDTIYLHRPEELPEKFKVCTVAKLLALAIRAIRGDEDSISALFEEDSYLAMCGSLNA
ncbi:MAG: ribose-phosphate diphosphokinase [Patescibacteria group bacterium]